MPDTEEIKSSVNIKSLPVIKNFLFTKTKLRVEWGLLLLLNFATFPDFLQTKVMLKIREWNPTQKRELKIERKEIDTNLTALEKNKKAIYNDIT